MGKEMILVVLYVSCSVLGLLYIPCLTSYDPCKNLMSRAIPITGKKKMTQTVND